MELTTLKEIIILILFAVVLLCVSVPLTFAHNAQRNGIDIFHSERYSKTVSILNCFAAGIFLGTCLLHLFPDVRENVTLAVKQMDPNQTFPFAEFTIAMGFFLLLTIEQIMSDVRERRFNKYPHLLPNQLPHETHDPCDVLTQPVVILHSELNDVSRERARRERVAAILSNNDFDETVCQAQTDYNITNDVDESDNADLMQNSSCSSNESDCHHRQQPLRGRISPTTQQLLQIEIANNYASIRMAAMIVALSIHSTFEGIAIGVQCTEADVLQITSALAIHKVVIAFSLGLGLVQSPLGTMKSAFFGLLFASTTPLGIGIGLGVTLYENDLNGSLIVGTLQGMAAGTFLYVTFMDVLPHEFGSKSSKFHLPKLLSFIIGFSVICTSLFIFPDS